MSGNTEIFANSAGAELVARSQAKHLLAPCEDVSEVTLNFSGVKSITPSFADEAFRVWPSTHPGVVVRHSGASDAVRSMIARALNNRMA